MRTRAVAWIGFGAAIVAACGTNSGSGGGGDGAPDDGGGGENMGIMPGDDAPSDGTGDGSGSSSSGGSSSGSGGDAAGDAPSDVAADGCAGQQPDPNGVFVSKGGQASGCGSETTPCTSIQTALTLAAMNGKTFVYVDTGTYTEQLTLPGAGITVQGGWTDLGGTWTRQCGASRASSVVVQAPGGVNTTVVAQYAGSATLDTLSIQSEPQAAVAAGESVYGVFATGASTVLTLSDVDVSAVAGGNGTMGGAGMQGQAGSPNGCAMAGNGGMGGNGSAGGGGTGSYDVQGFHRGDGQPGGSGMTGGNGSAANVQQQPTCVEECMLCLCDVSCDGGPNYCCDTGMQKCGAAGTSGCGGQGGGGGQGGAGGGASIAVFAWDAEVTITGGAYSPGNGATGGDGGAGAAGGAGSAGTGGGFTPVGKVGCHFVGQNCVSVGSTVLNGSAGGMGGTGGTGALGGGGAGGDSWCYYAGPNAKVSASGWSCTPGSPGKGGNQNQANQGANGNAGMHN